MLKHVYLGMIVSTKNFCETLVYKWKHLNIRYLIFVLHADDVFIKRTFNIIVKLKILLCLS
jgi:hypothetical protein